MLNSPSFSKNDAFAILVPTSTCKFSRLISTRSLTKHPFGDQFLILITCSLIYVLKYLLFGGNLCWSLLDLGVKTSRVLGPKCVPQMFLGWLQGTCRSAIGQFFPVLSNSSRSLCEKLTRPSLLICKVANSNSQRCCGLLQ